jgi:hypothetical protein
VLDLLRDRFFRRLAPRHIGAWIAILGLLGPASEPASANSSRSEAPSLLGTWYVLIHYRREGSPYPRRWYWDERVWTFQREGDALAWTEYTLVKFEDQQGRFEHLRTPRARRLLGAWTPNRRQRRELETGIGVNSRGSRRKLLTGDATVGWRSAVLEHAVAPGRKGYAEDWRIDVVEGLPEFRLTTELQHWGGARELGASIYRAEQKDRRGSELRGTYLSGDDRRGRFRMMPTRIEAVLGVDPEALWGASIALIPPPLPRPGERTLSGILRKAVLPREELEPQTISIDSTPPEADLAVVYLRGGAQLIRRKGRAPLKVTLPSRYDAGPYDYLIVSAQLAGREFTRVTHAVRAVPAVVELQLRPLPNQLLALAHGHLAGRSVFELRTAEEPTVQVREDASGVTLVFERTGSAEDAVGDASAMTDPLVRSVQVLQLDESLVLRLELRKPSEAVRVRHFSQADVASEIHRTRIELADLAEEASRITRLRETLYSMTIADLPACSEEFEAEMRRRLDPDRLASALSPHRNAEGPTLREALRQYAAVRAPSDLVTLGGERLPASHPLEFELATTRAAEIRGFLAWLRAFAQLLEPADRGALALRSLIAPDSPRESFEMAFHAAREAEQKCVTTPARY